MEAEGSIYYDLSAAILYIHTLEGPVALTGADDHVLQTSLIMNNRKKEVVDYLKQMHPEDFI